MDEEDWDTLERLLSQFLPGITPDEIEVIDQASDEKTGAVHFLINDEGDNFHLWTPEMSVLDLDQMDGPELLQVLISQAGSFQENKVLGTLQEDDLRYQRFGPWKDSTLDPLRSSESIPKIIKENGDLRLRIDVDGERYSLIIRRSPLKAPYSELILSRLNSTGFKNSPVLLGMSYWDDGSSPLAWMKFTSSEIGTGSGFHPFLSDLKSIIEEFHPMGEEKARKYLVKLSRGERIPSLSNVYKIGEMMGELHGKVMLDTKVTPSGKRGISSSITELFNPTRLKIGDVGSVLGLTSFYMAELKKEFIKLLGDRQRINPESGRKMRVLKSSRTHVDGVDLFDLGLFRESFLKRERRMRERFSSIRKLVGSPMVPMGIDARLDRMEFTETGDFILEHFGWELFNSEKGELRKFVPLKDLAMVLNSLNKARYLASRQMIKKAAATFRIDEKQLVSLFLEYNLAKVDYNTIMKDFNLFRTVSSRNVPFRHVFSISVIGSLWFERMRNGLINGYADRLQSMGRMDMLDYPKKVDTVTATDAIRSLLGLSSVLRIMNRGKVPSMIGLESELMNSICHPDQP